MSKYLIRKKKKKSSFKFKNRSLCENAEIVDWYLLNINLSINEHTIDSFILRRFMKHDQASNDLTQKPEWFNFNELFEVLRQRHMQI